MSISSDSPHAAPRPLIRPLPPAEPFPIAALDGLPAATTLAIGGLVQAPLALCAQSVLAAYTLAVQAHAHVVLPIGPGQARPLRNFIPDHRGVGRAQKHGGPACRRCHPDP